MIPVGILAAAHAKSPTPTAGAVLWSSSDKDGDITLSSDRRTATLPSGVGNPQQRGVRGEVQRNTGKVYFEAELLDPLSNTTFAIGVADLNAPLQMASIGTAGANYLVLRIKNGQVFSGNTYVGSFPKTEAGDRVGVALDIENRWLWFTINGASAQGDPVLGALPLKNLAPGEFRPVVYIEGRGSSVELVDPIYTPDGFSNWGEP